LRVSVLLTLFLLLLVAYAPPWVINPGASLSPNGYDLAEWSSVHPVAGGETPPLLTALLLRLPLVCATLMFVYFLTLNRNSRILGGAVVLLMGLALLPPLEILDDPGNWNYRQQLALAIFTVAGGMIGLTGWLGELRRIVGIVSAFGGTAACLVGLSHAYNLMQGFDLPVHIGAGGLATATLFLVTMFLQWRIGRRIWLRRPTLAIGQH
jgi:hypothetical protein